MAIYAAVVDHMDQAVGALVAGLQQRGVLDNTLILFMSDNGGNAESGPRGRLEGRTARRRQSDRLLRPVVGHAGEHAVPPLQALQPRRRHRHAADRALAGRHPRRNGELRHQPGHLIDIMATVRGRRPARPIRRSSTASRSSRWKGVSLRRRSPDQPIERDAPLLGARRQRRRARRRLEAGPSRSQRRRGSFTT